MHLVVADLMKQNSRPLRPSFKLRNEVMFRLPDPGRDRAEAKRADRIRHLRAFLRVVQ